jgi:Flp pilus assembly pilin Flp
MASRLQFAGTALPAQTGEQMINTLRKLWLEDDGQDLAEYGLLLILIAIVVVTAITAFQGAITAAFNRATGVLNPAA